MIDIFFELIQPSYIHRYLLHQLAPKIHEKVHVFNSFFYQRLSSAKLTNPTDLNDEKTGFQLVKSWTRSVNLFEKDFIVIPINENLHWFLAIICNPNCILNDSEEEILVDVDGEDSQATNIVDLSSDCRGDEAFCDILIFDSLGLTTRCKSTAVINRLRTYLQLEAQDKLNSSSSKSKCYGHVVKVPKQLNYTDCGCFVLQFVEEFFKGIPNGIIESLHSCSFNFSEWFPSELGQERRELMRERVRILAQDYSIRNKHSLKPDCNESNSSDIEEIIM